ncbi:FAD-binding oxidoreductase [Mesorhizobium australicum]|uniref:FAD/FMN-containing dehydrogenase n=1 Tax=Mesorhizobium australicum TaxID=536018 RepID=A0A1X7NFP8_9HYPH|nr:FAD-binding oxidoreductase [Mesorhizobium australicum]SMH36529.1 FAD/FMN-containing dehydrogenase [Mesorhizobium australicum]
MLGPGSNAPDAGDAADPALLERLASALPRNALLVGDAIDPRYQEDRRGRYSARPRFIARPGTTAEVAACLAACNAFGQTLVVHGGRTGLSGGHRIADGEAVLSTERLTLLGDVQPLTRTVLASAGTPLQAVQEAAAAAGYQFGVDIGARGTATVGGNVATNAGGIRVLRYGMFRAQVAGLETVLADGTVLSALRGLDKDNAGYDLNQLFIGSEGTLGVVTRALLRLHPKPLDEANAFVALSSVGAALALLERLRADVGSGLSAFEIMLPQAYEGVTGFLGMPLPLAARAPFYVLAEVQAFRDDQTIERFSQSLMEALDEGKAQDAVVSQSSREFQALWTMRDSCADYVRTRDHIMGGDLSVPIHHVEAVLAASQAAVRRIDPDTEFIVFGHLGDGNLHYVIRTPKAREAMVAVYALVAESGGSIAAEHGIGIDKKPWLHLSRSAAEINTMRRLKAALDPNAILNRGRIFDTA